MAPGYGDAETVSSNVQTAAVIFASGTAEEVGVNGKYELIDNELVLTEARSRGIFNRADHGPETGDTDYNQKWIFGTHSAIGGAAWNGDGPVGHSDPNDRAKAEESDEFIRTQAILSGIGINEVDDYGYEWLGEPDENPRE